MRALRVLSVAGATALVLACGALTGSEPDPTPAPTADAAPPPPAPPPAPPPPPSVEPDAGVDAGPLCETSQQKNEQVAAPEADGLIAVNATQKFGALTVCNMGVGRCLFRFAPSSAVLQAFASKKVVAMSLVLRRADNDSNCGGSCTSLRQDGTLAAFPLRADWDEAQMNWQNRRDNAPWGADGASLAGVDIGAQAATLAVLASDVSVTLPLDPAQWTSALLANSRLAVMTEFLSGANRRQFVTVAHEPGASPAEPAKLNVTYCP